MNNLSKMLKQIRDRTTLRQKIKIELWWIVFRIKNLLIRR